MKMDEKAEQWDALMKMGRDCEIREVLDKGKWTINGNFQILDKPTWREKKFVLFREKS